METKELIKVSYDANDNPTVLGRELHEALKIETPYTIWFQRMVDYGFSEGMDYVTFLLDRSDGKAGKPRTDHQLTIDMAKQICMIQRSGEGRRYREYFLKIEKQWNTPEAVMARALQMANKTVNNLKNQIDAVTKKLEIAAPKAEAFDGFMSTDTLRCFRDVCKDLGLALGANKFINLLIADKVLYRNNKGDIARPYQEYVTKGYFKMVERYSNRSGNSYQQTMVTPKGMEWLRKRYKDYIVNPTHNAVELVLA